MAAFCGDNTGQPKGCLQTFSVGQPKAHGHFGNGRYRRTTPCCRHEAPLLHRSLGRVVQAGKPAALRHADPERRALGRYVDLEHHPSLLATPACRFGVNRRPVGLHPGDRTRRQDRSNGRDSSYAGRGRRFRRQVTGYANMRLGRLNGPGRRWSRRWRGRWLNLGLRRHQRLFTGGRRTWFSDVRGQRRRR